MGKKYAVYKIESKIELEKYTVYRSYSDFVELY